MSGFFLFSLLLLIGMACRSIPLWLPYYTTDQTGVALQAWNILQGEWPIYYYGQAFQGTLEGYLCAILFALFAPNWDLALGLLSILSSVLFLIFFFLFVRNVFGKPTAFISLLLAAAAPPLLMQWGHDPRLHYSFVLVYQAFLFWMTSTYLKKPFIQISRVGFFFYSMVAGLAWWTNFLNIHTLFACGFLLLLKEPRTLIKRLALPGLAGFITGSFPFWVFNATHDWINFKLNTFRGWEAFKQYFPDFILYGLPNIMGLKEDYGLAFYPIVLYAGLVLFVLAFIYFLFVNKTPFLKGKGLVIFTFISVAVITCASVFGRAVIDDGDYLVPLMPLCLIVIGSLIAAVLRRSKMAAFVILAFFILNSGIQNYYNPVQNLAYFNPAQKKWIQRYNYSNQVLFDTIRGLNITGLYKDPDEIFKLKYLGYPDVFTSDFYQDNYPPGAQKADAAKNVGFVLRNPLKGLATSLEMMGVGYQTTQLPDYLLFHSFALKQNHWALIDRTNWQATSSHQKTKTGFAFDGQANTRWTSDKPKEPGMWFELDLGQPTTVNRLSIHPGHWQDYPSALKVEVSDDQKEWKEILSYPFIFGPFYWDGTHPFYRIRRARVDLNFPPVSTRYIRMTHLGQSTRYFWSIMELYAYGPAPETKSHNLVEESQAIIQDLKAKKITFAAADHWLSARIGSQTKVKVYLSNRFTGINREINPDPNTFTPLFLDAEKALIVTSDKEKETIERLKKQGVEFETKLYGHYILFSGFKSKSPQPFYWAGDHLLEL